MKNKTERKDFGIATFVGGEYETLNNCHKYDVAYLGVPDEMGASYRLGTQYAPRAVREHSMWKTFNGMECYDYDNRKYVDTNKLNVCDLGDLNVYLGDQEKTLKELEDVTKEISKTTFPVIVGGDHSITYGSFIGTKKGTNCKKMGLIHFDAHNDTEPDEEFYPRICHSNQFTKLIKEGHLDGNNMVTIGLRGFVDRKWHDFAMEQGITIVTANEFNYKNSLEDMMNIFKDKFKDCDGVYVTFDMDSLEIGASSGVGTPKYNGINLMKTLELLRMLKDLNIVAFDLVELNPVLDVSGVTSFLAWEILFNFLALGLNVKKD